ncbi:hypothetical protein [Pedobacter endophyticus]|uniref:Uncharacterized protein n=1 Tax=Pedobacter endophyticus TaxID=2789740 RepID=A0A7S9PZZ7_9SPHI|nr:hypothetical protein [Pedobacter endophyticus]QPH40177.1 hypothetical protein IZT61_02535 [Pedobacter endophyticus]
MKLKDPILNILKKNYEPSAMIEQKFGRYDLSIKTDIEGRPILLFMGKKDENGFVRGERYARTLKFNSAGSIIKDHWEHKGKATP